MNLTKKHYDEWVSGSGVHPDLVALNVRSLFRDDPYKELLYSEQLPRRNDGRLRNGILKQYRHIEVGGWWCGSIDLLTGKESLWGCFKPNHPRLTQEGKLIKYEHPAKTATEIFALKVPDTIWQRIAERHGVYPYCPLAPQNQPLADASPNEAPPLHTLRKDNDLLFTECVHNPYAQFWAWVIEANIPLCLTEGAKKAGSLLNCGYCAIAVPGIFNGYRQPKDEFGNKIGFPHLIPQLKPFATKGREINFCFDNDPKPKTRINVRKAIEKTGKLFSLAGCEVKVIQWDTLEKGVDDLIVAKSRDYFEEVYNSRISLAEYQLNSFLDLTPYVDLTINERYIPEGLHSPHNAKLIALRSLHGTGKTEWLSDKIEVLLNDGQRVLVIVHREQLARELSRRFGVDYRTEIKTSETGGIFGYALCIDSLHPSASPPFEPEKWQDAVVVIDEVEQVLWHLLNGGTCASKRTQILKTFKKLLQTVAGSELGKIFIADADLSLISINYIEQLIGFKVPKFIVNNSYTPVGYRQLYRCSGNTPEQVVKRLEKNLRNGQKAIIHTDGQKHKSKWGTRNLEAYVKQNFPDLKVLRLDRQSVKDKDHPAYGCIDHLNEVLVNYDVVICSPVIETGVSIDIQHGQPKAVLGTPQNPCPHFDGVYVISHGVQTVDSVVQSLQRVRDNIPRYVWCKAGSTTRIGNGSYAIRTLLSSTHKLASANISMLQKMGITEVNDLTFIEQDEEIKGASPSLTAWAKRACVINHQNGHFADSVIAKCQSLGYRIVDDFEDNKDSKVLLEGARKGIASAISEIRDENYHHYCEEVSQRENLDDKTYENLKEKQRKGKTTETEDQTLEKATISRLYATEKVTPELIEKHDDRWYPQLILHYYLTVGNCYLPKKDRKAMEKLKEEGEGEVFKPDFNRTPLGLKIFTLQTLGMERFLDPSAEFSSETEAEWFEKINTPIMRFQIKAVLNESIGQKDSAIGFIQRILAKLGLKLRFDRQQTVNGKRVRIYQGCLPNLDGRSSVFERWLERDQQSEEIAA